MTRTEFGYSRSTCACHACATNCRFMPGYLIPDDLARMYPGEHTWVEWWAWAEQNLLASPGATVVAQGEVIQIRTLVPKTKPDGSCKNLDENGLCQIHEAAPFGCAFFDCKMDFIGSQPLSIRGLITVANAWANGGLYCAIWTHLSNNGFRQEHSNVLRARMDQYLSG